MLTIGSILIHLSRTKEKRSFVPQDDKNGENVPINTFN
jgi:hypothetical protein